MAIISAKSDYRYIDLSGYSDSVVGSDIYPLRDADKKKLIKFCDLAFIYEATLSRRCAFAGINWNGAVLDATANSLYKKYAFSSPVPLLYRGSLTASFDNFFISSPAIFSQVFDGQESYSYNNSDIFVQGIGALSFGTAGNIAESVISNTFKKPATSSRFKDSGIYYFKSYSYAAKALDPITSGKTYAIEQWGDITWGATSNIEYQNYTQKSGGENGFLNYQTSPIYSLDIAEPAASAVEVSVYAVVYLSTNNRNDDEPYGYVFTEKIENPDGETCSRRWIEKAKTIWRGQDVSSGSVTHQVSLSAEVEKIFLVVKFKEDIDY